ncbi:MAG: ABC transporter substrate-binding protein [Thermostichales cyanobacterium BF4_bins_65]
MAFGTAAVLVGSQWRRSAQAQTLSQSTVKFTLSWLPSAMDSPLFIGLSKGYFRSQGLEVTYERGFGSADTVTKIAAGQFDLGEGDPYSMMEFNSKNPDRQLRAVYFHYNNSPFGIYTLKRSGINDPKQLAGKKLGAPAGDAPRRLWPVYARQVGIDPNSVEWLTMEPRLRETFLIQGQVDAISGFITSAVPNLVRGGVKLEDINMMLYNQAGLPLYGNAILTRAEFLEKHPDTVAAFLRAYVQSAREMIANPEQALQITLAEGRATAQVLDEATERLRLEIALNSLFVSPEVRENGLGTVDPQRFARSVGMVAAGFGLKTVPKPGEVFVGQFLPPMSERSIA